MFVIFFFFFCSGTVALLLRPCPAEHKRPAQCLMWKECHIKHCSRQQGNEWGVHLFSAIHAKRCSHLKVHFHKFHPTPAYHSQTRFEMKPKWLGREALEWRITRLPDTKLLLMNFLIRLVTACGRFLFSSSDLPPLNTLCGSRYAS